MIGVREVKLGRGYFIGEVEEREKKEEDEGVHEEI